MAGGVCAAAGSCAVARAPSSPSRCALLVGQLQARRKHVGADEEAAAAAGLRAERHALALERACRPARSVAGRRAQPEQRAVEPAHRAREAAERLTGRPRAAHEVGAAARKRACGSSSTAEDEVVGRDARAAPISPEHDLAALPQPRRGDDLDRRTPADLARAREARLADREPLGVAGAQLLERRSRRGRRGARAGRRARRRSSRAGPRRSCRRPRRRRPRPLRALDAGDAVRVAAAGAAASESTEYRVDRLELVGVAALVGVELDRAAARLTSAATSRERPRSR